MPIIDRFRTASSFWPATQLGLLAAAITLVRALAHGAPLRILFEAPAVAFATFFVLALVALSLRRRTASGLDVSPWFAWLAAGGFAAFWLGAIAFQTVRSAWYVVAAWTGLIAIVWVGARLWLYLRGQRQ
jgi:hypothetical protein